MIIDLSTAKTLLCVAGLSLVALSAHGQRSSGLSADFIDSHTLSIQKKVDVLFERGEYKRALFLYRNDLAPVGDKYAQYMIGFMHVSGLGTEQDIVTGSAWYRLAAERDTPEFAAVSERLMRALSDEQLHRSNILLAKLRLEYGDLAVLLASIKRGVNELETRTGSRLMGDSSPVSVISGRAGGVRSGADYFGEVERRLEYQLQRIVEIGGFEDIDTNPRHVNVNELERLVKELIESKAY